MKTGRFDWRLEQEMEQWQSLANQNENFAKKVLIWSFPGLIQVFWLSASNT